MTYHTMSGCCTTELYLSPRMANSFQINTILIITTIIIIIISFSIVEKCMYHDQNYYYLHVSSFDNCHPERTWHMRETDAVISRFL